MDITPVNLILAALILVLGVVAYLRTRVLAALLLGVAFGLFAVAHLLTMLGFAATQVTLLVVIRLLGYIAAAVAALRLGSQR